jgi:hypothetical protein
LRLAGEEKHLAVRTTVAHVDGKLYARHDGHHNVRDEQVRNIVLIGLQSTKSHIEGDCFESLLAKNHRQGGCNYSFIIDDKNSKLPAVPGHGDSVQPESRPF